MSLVSLSRRTLLAALLAVVVPATVNAQTATPVPEDNERHVLLVSFDGFRSDYADNWDLANFQDISREGASSRGLIPSYPSKTFPNHYTLVTGLYPGRHGLVDNSFYSPPLAASYRMADRSAVENPQFYGGLPLWQHLSAHGIKTASYFWVGSETKIAGHYPDYYRLYDGRVANEARIRQVLEWLQLPDAERPRFITLYFSFVDSVAHDTGPASTATHEAALQADALLGQLRAGLSELSVPVDLLVVSDHGMYPVIHDPAFYIATNGLGLTPEDGILVISQTQAQLYVNDPARIPALYQQLQAREDHFRVYLKQETPPHWHYRDHAHIGDILLVAEPGYVIVPSTVQAMSAGRPYGPGDTYGVHGYDASTEPALHGIFYAWGPSIRAGVSLPAFENVHVFPLITRLFGVPNPDGLDGKETVLAPILAE